MTASCFKVIIVEFLHCKNVHDVAPNGVPPVGPDVRTALDTPVAMAAACGSASATSIARRRRGAKEFCRSPCEVVPRLEVLRNCLGGSTPGLAHVGCVALRPAGAPWMTSAIGGRGSNAQAAAGPRRYSCRARGRSWLDLQHPCRAVVSHQPPCVRLSLKGCSSLSSLPSLSS